jgi:hypothetical protein
VVEYENEYGHATYHTIAVDASVREEAEKKYPHTNLDKHYTRLKKEL